jgi:hypothetical protein
MNDFEVKFIIFYSKLETEISWKFPNGYNYNYDRYIL